MISMQKMGPFTKMTDMTPDNVVDYVANFAAEVHWVMIVMMMVTQQIPTMTKTHHGGNLSVMNMVGICQWQNPTIDNDNDDG